jgi:hypothetical protein
LICSQLVSYFIKISDIYYGIIYLYMNVFRCVFIYCLIESLEYACLLVIVMHVVRYFLLCILINLKKKVSVRERSPKVDLKVLYPGLWVVEDVTDWYQSFWLKH